ncbi:hypothetical protein PHYSODRAFT_408884, partial [Phytophthora sojae]
QSPTHLMQYAVLAQAATNTFVPQRCGLSLLNWRMGLYRERDGNVVSSKLIIGGGLY